MTSATIPYKRTTLLVALALTIGSLYPLWAAWQQHDNFLNDDTYITLTYAKNLVTGNGFVYNHPPATYGTTSPLLALSVAALGKALPWLDLQTIVVFFTACCWAGVAWVIFLQRGAFGLRDWQAGIVGLALLATGWPVYLGMEAYLFAFLLILSLSLYLRRDRLLCGLAVGLLCLTRGEGLLFFAILIAADAITLLKGKGVPWRDRFKPPALAMAGFAAVIIPWLAFARLVLGSFLPNSLYVKLLQGQLGYIPTFGHMFFSVQLKMFGAPLALTDNKLLSPWWLLLLLGMAYIAVHNRRWLLLVAWMIAYVTAYSLMGVADYGWYRLPVLFCLQIMAALGLLLVIELVARGLRYQWLRIAVPACLCIPYLLVLGGKSANTLETAGSDKRGETYSEISTWLRANADPDDSIAVNEVGYFGYFTDNRTVDLSGLVTPEAIPALQRSDLSTPFWQHEPDYLISIPHYGGVYTVITDDPEFKRRYRPVASFSSPWANESDLLIYRRAI